MAKKKKEIDLSKKIQEKIIFSMKLDDILLSVLKETPEIIGAETSSVFLFDPLTKKLKCHYLETENEISSFYISPEQGYGGWVYSHNQPLILNSPSSKEQKERLNNFPSDIKSIIATPLSSGDEKIGVLEVFNKKKGFFKNSDLTLLNNISEKVTKLISSARQFKEVVLGLQQTIKVLSASIDARNPFTKGHSLRVSELTLLLAKKTGYPNNMLDSLYLATLLHDVGKIKIDDKIIKKKGFLTDKEYEVMKLHPEYGAQIILDIEYLHDTAPFVLYHHERYDGLGYPHGLKGEDIPLESKMIALADTFDALTSERAYREKFNFEKAVAEIKRCGGSQFDPHLAQVFLGVVEAN
ncbi:MAG: HD domain-containing protein [Actinomycetia bacterium]|nr:HD domain-containing protein [Actinomycetes bacterium]